ncbi:helix-turn-helix domain-containing protein [Amycolatopsis magusensis]|uniref:DNA-binding transcriptional ArsR family regulator n=1 Tax=Amycolatopsis magusensis TaxID=882444 RepID=A0ABS4PT13_9PSEU|nr:helix-turn-helix domain-containing protein [Amycolatopsis magusensis]MBP2182572.1 DNA-binding transcriptional ArsR family regulator [Amycolatopsis magusensis]MDI5980317.1 helix-turn-helix domain-containing protein [Amycolatopsis magusensis]
MPEVLHATSPAQMRAFAHPTRHRIWRDLGPEGATISQLAHRLRVNKGNIAHHLGVLAEAGLVRKGPTRTVRGGTEQYFVKTAAKVRFGPGEDGVATKAMLATIADEIPAHDEGALLLHRVVRLTAAQARALQDHLESVVHDLAPANEREAEYGVLVGLYRRA